MPPKPDICFLELDEILSVHADKMAQYGGGEGLRDLGLLQSALAMPAAQFGGEFLHRDLFEMAAAYLFHIVQNHPFVDGNKRTGASAANIFLILNGIELTLPDDAFATTTLAVSTGKLDKKACAAIFRENHRMA